MSSDFSSKGASLGPLILSPAIGETFQQFAVRLGWPFNRWIEMSGIAFDYENLRDLMIRD
jgi:hypothetical protein